MRRLLLLCLLAGCSSGDGVGPGTAPRIGRYHYTFSAPGLSVSGTMLLTYATEDSIAGSFDVNGFEPTLDLGFNNAGAYVVYAHPTIGGLAQQRMTLDGQELSCGGAQYFVTFSDIRPGSCSTAYQGP